MEASVRSGLKDLNLVKTSQATFVGFHRDAYRTLKDLHERVLRSALASVE
jgi:urate oxidase